MYDDYESEPTEEEMQKFLKKIKQRAKKFIILIIVWGLICTALAALVLFSV